MTGTLNSKYHGTPCTHKKKNTLKKEERPSGRDRREIIRLVTAEILAVCKNPLKKHLSEIARKMVLAYPKSFKDVIEGQIVGSGYDSITKQLQCRVDNFKRVQPPKILQTSSGGNTTETKRRRNAYGCIDPEPHVSLNTEAQKQELQRMFEENDMDQKKIERLMMYTFASQRMDVLNQKDIQILKEEWPYLFHTTGLKAHFNKLTGIHVNEEFEEAMTSKFSRVLQYFRYIHWEKGSHAAKLLSEIESARGDLSVVVLMLLLHFKEDESKFFIQVEDTCVSAEVRREALPPTPCIVVCGDSHFTATGYMVAVDQVVVMDRISTLSEAVVNMFMMYYVMNIDYPAEAGITLEFLQRCIFKINPDNGSKVEKQEKRKRIAVNPRVLSLISKMSEYDWME
nr:uncharacterized protein LOC111853741 [Paramormyrops kingsleyae]